MEHYIGTQYVTERRKYFVTVVAESLEEAEAKLAAGEGVRYAYIESTEISADPVIDVQIREQDGGW